MGISEEQRRQDAKYQRFANYCHRLGDELNHVPNLLGGSETRKDVSMRLAELRGQFEALWILAQDL